MSKGHVITQIPEQADVVVINTCAVTQDAVRKSRQLIRRTHRNNPTAKLVVSGCYSSLNKALSDEIEGIDLIVPNHDKEKLVELNVHLLKYRMAADIAVPIASLPLRGEVNAVD